MIKRFLNNKDYNSVITENGLKQLTRGDDIAIYQAEEAAESSVIEHLIDNYEIEKELNVGKEIIEYDPRITMSVGNHFYKDGEIWEVVKAIRGRIPPIDKEYWVPYSDHSTLIEIVKEYSQFQDYSQGDIVRIGFDMYKCVIPNGPSLKEIVMPNVMGWSEIFAYDWRANVDYNVWEVVKFNNHFYALLNKDEIDLTVDPHKSNNWGLIGAYDPKYDRYELSENEYVEYKGKLYVPTMNVNADKLEEGYNIRRHDPRNRNLIKHISRIAVYELHKLISPNNVSTIRIEDYKGSMQWLRDAAKLRINPQIMRRLDYEGKPVEEYATSTFMRDYDPNKNPWQV